MPWGAELLLQSNNTRNHVYFLLPVILHILIQLVVPKVFLCFLHYNTTEEKEREKVGNCHERIHAIRHIPYEIAALLQINKKLPFGNLPLGNFYYSCNSSAPHGMKTKIFKNLQKSYEKLFWNLYRIIIIVRFLKIFVRGKGGVLLYYKHVI